MGDKLHFVGVDDGYAETKIVLPNGQRLRLPSQARAGESQSIQLQSGQSARVFGYMTDEGPFVAGALENSDATAFDGYPVSAMNRVVVAHALREAGLTGEDRVAIASGLPVRRYYRQQAPNKTLIENKRANLLKNDVFASDGTALARIVEHEVLAEGVAAWIDYVMQRNSQGHLEVNPGLAQEKIGIVDIGGRTTDIAVVQDWEMDAGRSSTLDVGMIDIRDIARQEIEGKHDVSLTDAQVLQGISEGAIQLFGRNIDVSEAVRRAEQTTVNRIRTETLRCLGNGSDLNRVIFVGGTVMALEARITGWFEHQIVGAAPAYANASGLQKSAEFLQG